MSRQTPAMTRIHLADKVSFLQRAASYPQPVRNVVAIETHFSWVFLAGRHAYKLKKPVRQAPMDYLSVASRRRACEREVALNRRLAPRVYVRVVPLSRNPGGGLVLGPGAHVVDWLVKMRRLPAHRMLDRVLARGGPSPVQIQAIVDRLMAFYSATECVRMSGPEYLARMRRRVRENRQALLGPQLGVDAALVRRISATQLAYLDAGGQEVRARARRVVDCHGDLRPEHVYLGPPLAIIDRLEFSPDLRAMDPLEELAFLALECRRLGGEASARLLLEHAR
ncbi:MAG TPA: hypothetical protein VJ011_09415, partial [Steroidobacteraceae bacterium]|nr:hypothetical protein [Steroidobacteraceae bacterium]